MKKKNIQLKHDLCHLLRRGGFRLRKWTSNSLKLLESIPKEDRELQIPLDITNLESIKTLGLHWNPIDDAFSFKVDLETESKICTKRAILSLTAKLFDPIGWIAPTVIMFKILLQLIWVSGVSWDDNIPNHLHTSYLKLLSDIKNIENIKIPRWIYTSTKQTTIELHGFCDASNQAYAAVIYSRIINNKGEIYSSIITSKTKVAPIKVISTPRLELCGAVLLTKLMSKTIESMKLENSTIKLWTDSTIVLAWIQNQPNKYKSFVANRVSEIQEKFNAKHWKYVPSSLNPADCATRGLEPSILLQHVLWWKGPPFLSENESCWPEFKLQKVKFFDTEEKPIHAFITLTTQSLLSTIERFSSFSSLVRVFALVLRFINNSRYSNKKNIGAIQPKELSKASEIIIKAVQKVYFQSEITALKQNQRLLTTSKMLTLNPFLDTDNILRVGGRLHHSSVSYQQKHPIILPAKSHLTWLIVNKAHLETLHGVHN